MSTATRNNADTKPLVDRTAQQAAAAHRPDLYLHDAVATGPDSLDEITEAHIEQYREQGFLAVQRALSPVEIDAALQGLSDLAAGRVPDFPMRRLMVEGDRHEVFESLPDRDKLDALRKVAGFVGFEPRLKALSVHPKLTDVMRRIMGDEPVLFQDMALVKPPKGGREKPWHQDCAYFDYKPGTPVVGVWIGLDEATLFNGCMHVLPGLHREGPRLHFGRRDWQMCDTDAYACGANHCVAVPLPPGGMLLFDGLLPHGTPTNGSSDRRRALQYHYAPKHAEKLDRVTRQAVYGGDAKGYYC